MKKNLFNLIKITTLAIVFSFGLSYIFAWSGNNNPTMNNKEPTIDISSTKQSKGGSIVGDYVFHINGLLSADHLLVVGPSIFDGDFIINGFSKKTTDKLCADEDGEIIYCDSQNIQSFASVTIGSVSNINYSGATINTNTISSDGGSTIFKRGVVWGTTISPLPVIATNNFTLDGAGSTSYSSNISGLNPNTTYYVRAYTENSIGVSYSSNYRSFKTTPTPNLLQVSRLGEALMNGTIISNTGPINCGTVANCQAFYSAGDTVVLSASATTGSFLTGWDGCTSTSGSLPNQTCSVTMNSPVKTVTANFISCNGKYVAGYCWYKADLNQNCTTYCSSYGHGSCVQSTLNYTIDTQICSALSMGPAQTSAPFVSPRADTSNCYVYGNPSTPTANYNSSTCNSIYSQWHTNACSCSR